MKFSSRTIFAFLAFGLSASFVLSLFVSRQLAQTVAGELERRETELVFASIESGPLAIARLHSAAIAQQELTRIMTNPKLSNRGITGVRILGGESSSFEFASWKGPQQFAPDCVKTLIRDYQYADALNPFQVVVQRDGCFTLPEERIIFHDSAAASFLVTVIAAMLLACGVLPVAASIRQAERALGDANMNASNIVSYMPIQSLLEKAIRSIRLEKEATLGSLAAQVSHDIRSPLSALSMVTQALTEIPEEKRLIIRSATQRINDIANELLQQSKRSRAEPLNEQSSATSESEPVMLIAALDTIISEKRVQYKDQKDIEIVADLNHGYGLFVKVNAKELSRVISNLVNNAVEALEIPGRIVIAVRSNKDSASIIVNDDGKGMPPEILSRVGERGLSYGKDDSQSGSGLGLFHATEFAKSSGGKISIQSAIGAGTMVTITLPRAPTPTWFADKIIIEPETTLVTVDDDPTIHKVWSERFSSPALADLGITRMEFLRPDLFSDWFKTKGVISKHVLFLVDYEFVGHSLNGLELIEKLAIGKNSILVTSRHDDSKVRATAARLGTQILPKSLTPCVPIIAAGF